MYQFTNVAEAYNISRNHQRSGSVPEFPPYVTFELSNVCNFRCIMCVASYEKKNRIDMDFAMFTKAADEISKYGSLIRFIGFDEPLLYKRIEEAIQYVKKKRLLLHITTNGSLLDDRSIAVIADAKVDSIIFSFQGLSEAEYCKMRNVPAETYGKVIANIKKLYARRKDHKPNIQITTTVTHRDDLEHRGDFVDRHLSYADKVQITGFTHFVRLNGSAKTGELSKQLGLKEPRFVPNVKCYAPNYDVIVKEDGSIYLCCAALSDQLCIGNLSVTSIKDAWHSQKAYDIRKALNAGDLDAFDDCRYCEIRYEYDDLNNSRIHSGKGGPEDVFRSSNEMT